MNQRVSQNDFLKPVRIYWHNLKQLVLRHNQFYLTRKPSTNWRYRLLSCLPPILFMALVSALIANQPWLALAYLAGAYLAIGLLVVMEKYLLLIFDEKKSFVEVLDVVATGAPALYLGWIPQFGIPLACLLLGFWLWKGLSCQFKMGTGAALLGTTLPVVLFVGLTLFLAFIASWVTAIEQMLHH